MRGTRANSNCVSVSHELKLGSFVHVRYGCMINVITMHINATLPQFWGRKTCKHPVQYSRCINLAAFKPCVGCPLCPVLALEKYFVVILVRPFRLD